MNVAGERLDPEWVRGRCEQRRSPLTRQNPPAWRAIASGPGGFT